MRMRNINFGTRFATALLSICAASICCLMTAAASSAAQGEPPADAEPQLQERDAEPNPNENKTPNKTHPEQRRLGAAAAAEQELLTQWREFSACSAHIKVEASTGQMIFQPGGEWEPQMYVRGEGSYELQKQGDKVRVRVELTGKSFIHKSLDEKEPPISKLSRIYDGEYLYSVAVNHGETYASKTNLSDDDFILLGGEDFFKGLRRRFLLKRLPDETVETRDAVVIEGKRIGGDDRVVQWFDKKTGLIILMKMFDKSGNLKGRLTLSDIKIDPKFNEKRFKFIPPRGVEVKDLTKQGG